MTYENLLHMLRETGIPFAYDHFAEGESPEPPFICFLLPASDNFSADGEVYHKIISSSRTAVPCPTRPSKRTKDSTAISISSPRPIS